MKKFLTLAIANFFLQLVSAQVSNNQEVIGSAGEQLKTTQGSVNFTVGESVILTYINNPSGVEVNQGFQQTYFKITEVTERPFAEFNIRVFVLFRTMPEESRNRYLVSTKGASACLNAISKVSRYSGQRGSS